MTLAVGEALAVKPLCEARPLFFGYHRGCVVKEECDAFKINCSHVHTCHNHINKKKNILIF